jgi:CBS domain-containing protein
MLIKQVLARKGAAPMVRVAGLDRVSAAVRAMSLNHVDIVVVADTGRRLLGTVSERDIVDGLTAVGPEILDRSVAGVMKTGGPSCAPGDLVRDVLETMTTGRVAYLPVVQDGQVVGVISREDVVASRLDEKVEESRVLLDLVRLHH